MAKHSVFFDTSVLIPALIRSLPHHAIAGPLMRQVRNGEFNLHVSTHSIAEMYAALTTIPTSPRITPGQATELVSRGVLEVAKIVSLTGSDYRQVMARMTSLGLSGGAVYDALQVRAAEKAKVNRLYTFNGRDFRRMPPAEGTELIVLA